MHAISQMEKKRVLVVDDELSALRALSSLLVEDGFDVTTASNGREGLEAAQAILPDLIVTDVNMPEMDGFSMIRQIHDTLGRIPVIFMTVRDRPLDVVVAINEGARHYVHKPVDYADLEAKVRRALR